MFRSGLLAVVLWGFASVVAHASDKPEIGAPDAWVLSQPKPLEPMKASAGSPLAILMQDNQIRFAAQGLDFYQSAAVKIQTAQGLQAMSTLSLSWSPETDRLVVHKVRILRADQAIDALPKDGTFTIARREDKLDSEGQLNGVLTAIVQIEGLQVGDVVEMAYTIHRHDPLFKDRVDQVVGIADGAPITFDRIRMSWPQSLPVRWRVAGGMPEPRVTNDQGLTQAEIVLENVTPLIKPQGAPARFQRGREFGVSSYRDWSDVSGAMAPLFDAAVRLKPESPIKAEAAAIAARTGDPELRAAAALALVQDKIRYLAQVFGEGGYKPAAADDTWLRRYGDCKAKTVLLIALLNELGIKAEPALVSTILGDDLEARLPGLSPFNHVFVHATIAGRDYWLDGTRSGDLSLAALETPNFGSVLPVRYSGAGLVRLRPEPYARPETRTLVRIDASEGLDHPAPAHVEVSMHGDAATAMRLAVANLAPDDLDRALRDYWRQSFDYITVTSSKAVYDSKTAEETLVLDGQAKLDWSSGYEPEGASLGWKADVVRDPAAINPTAPFEVNYPRFIENDVTVVLPNHGEGFRVWGDQVDRELFGRAFHRKAVIENGAFHMQVSVRSLAPEIAFAQAKADAERLTAMGKTTLKLMPPTDTASIAQAAKAADAKTPVDAAGYIARGNTRMNAQRYRESIADYDAAVKLDPSAAGARANRAMAHALLGEAKEALSDADEAEAMNARLPAIYRARGVVAERAGDWQAAVTNFTRSVDLAPDGYGYSRLADAYINLKDYTHALRNLDAELALKPDDLWPHLRKAPVYIRLKDLDKARAEVDAVKSAAATDASLREGRFRALIQLDDRKTARAEADAAVAAQPTAVNYLLRIQTRDPADADGREADARAALGLDPKSIAAMRYLFILRMTAKDYAAAVDWAAKAHALAPDDVVLLTNKAQAETRLGYMDEARSDFATARVKAATDSMMLNNICYEQATSNLDLSQALKDCDAALVLQKAPNIYDSRAFVLLRLGRNSEALADFNRALADAPDLPASLYGRSLVERRLGDTAAADKDRAAALAKAPKVAETYADYGVKE